MSQLLSILCEKIDGTLFYFTKFLLEVLDYIVKANKGDKTIEITIYKILPNYQNNYFLIHTEDSNIIETIFLCFSILSAQITRRFDLVY